MHIRARVQSATGNTRHGLAHLEGDRIVKDADLPTPAWVEIQPGDGAFYLLYLDDRADAQTDTWHPTLAAAKAQAFHEFGIEEADWQVLEP